MIPVMVLMDENNASHDDNVDEDDNDNDTNSGSHEEENKNAINCRT